MRRLGPYRAVLIVLCVLTLTILTAVLLVLVRFFTTDADGGPVPASYVREGYVDAIGLTLLLTPLILLAVSPVWAITLLAQAYVLKKKRSPTTH